MTNANENPKMTWSRKDWILLGANVLLFAILYLIFNDQLPDTVNSHYNTKGEADDTMAKRSFWLLYAGIGLVLPTVLSLLRYIDPRKGNYTRFEGYYNLMRWSISFFIHAIMLVVIMDNLGEKLPVVNLINGGLGILWIIIGNRMGQLRSNFFIGIKTPWALSDDNNWRMTHRLAGRLWVIAGLVMFVSAWFVPATWTIAVLLICTMGSSLIPLAYSYLLHKRKAAV
ncbi:SdpI family protein [Cohnella luojiensis]|uniref:DUF1648 domain-containing protein n=1 Tax=Cohnella luojiensis TaxID=652876 RepID=A0A4Y8M1T0_9BACL|nr:SdpI family protein [Cohnella luojiensis]TFE29067.1 DUF1648 domain-containing protein [Cohnella luojiensis]